ncbi:FAD-binding domain-containing protein [Pseudovirgaria hyperparasitica]|uniref:FAD-binding domain-containing protein n=1 Tax=Pseudovirgaria hyperparasitica TaxID=470096 RepID=A0A6A6VZX2_9PEZI|nr:FAD-binding domain-containing protein [Pseudovirgaria hyperparasitica]KAF2756228.1 FAD-binding domain-containing protein [Pseudovirgaria hyperparasitica]
MRFNHFVIAVALASARCVQGRPSSPSDSVLQILYSIPQGNNTELKGLVQEARPIIDSIGSQKPPNDQAQRNENACTILKTVLRGHYTDSTNQVSYDTLLQKNYASQCHLPPACFITPNSNAAVAITLKIIDLTQAKFSVRSGGHNVNPGWAGVSHGVIIDTQELNTIQLRPDRSSVRVGTGNRFGTVQEYLDPYNVSVVSGHTVQPGVGGVLLGGGLPLVSTYTGMGADNIKSAEVITSDSRVVIASATENPDLFRALKGGVNNFGIVTHFELYTSKVHDIWFRALVYSSLDPLPVFDALQKTQVAMESDDKAGLVFTILPFGGFMVDFFYVEPTYQPEVFAAFDALTPVSAIHDAVNGTVYSIMQNLTNHLPPANRYSTSCTIRVDTDLYTSVYNRYHEMTQKYSTNTTAFQMVMHPYGSATTRISKERGGNVMGDINGAQTILTYGAQWTDDRDNEKIYDIVDEITQATIDEAEQRGLDEKFIFANGGSFTQNVLASYGEENLKHIRAASKKFDRKQMFQSLQNGGFLVSRA